MIDAVGLIHSGNEEQIPFAYELYAHSCRSSRRADLDRHKGQQSAEHFKRTFSRQGVKVHFVGVWDTVSSVGVFRSKDMPHVDTVDHICYFRHALSLDEKRVRFSPEDVYHSRCSAEQDAASKSDVATGPRGEQRRTPSEEHVQEKSNTTNSPQDVPGQEPATNTSQGGDHIKEVWFAGCHSDVGGGNKPPEGKVLIDDIPVFWMVYEAWKKGLKVPLTMLGSNFDYVDLEFKPQNSLKWGWYILECLPFFSRRDDFPHKPFRWILPHSGAPRYIHPDQKIHASVKVLLNEARESSKKYQPQARFRPKNSRSPIKAYSWNDIKSCRGKMESDVIEQGIYGDEIVTEQIHRLCNATDVDKWCAFLILGSLEKGVSAFVEACPETFKTLLYMRKSNKYCDETAHFIMRLAKHEIAIEQVLQMFRDWRRENNDKPFLDTLLEAMHKISRRRTLH